jgi:hypothetical protein
MQVLLLDHRCDGLTIRDGTVVLDHGYSLLITGVGITFNNVREPQLRTGTNKVLHQHAARASSSTYALVRAQMPLHYTLQGDMQEVFHALPFQVTIVGAGKEWHRRIDACLVRVADGGHAM